MSFAQEAAQQAAPEKKAIAFKNDAGIVLIYVKADKTADFEDLLNKLKDGLAKTEVAEAKQQAASLKFLKAPAGRRRPATCSTSWSPTRGEERRVPGSCRTCTSCIRIRRSRRRCSTSGRGPRARSTPSRSISPSPRRCSSAAGRRRSGYRVACARPGQVAGEARRLASPFSRTGQNLMLAPA